ncbi:MAG: siderophore-interacting protein [Gordonia sp.]|jgi:NADPH-dependent ferric siderophore reductase|uniref:siderophore-interacting protein n=3 Tax=Gordonia TaxID=2053 RepID=UPI001D596E16|nr:siderophore-interacting protein [Gordonia sp. (in: high G+C Gram-positive bacteria)]MCB1293577.1 siderophore-interacting protein [Gordonia sp. (in: high G+C Gram-positive bacteria)]HMS76139.1 siderophore-interacting protein [Gordonia sp. (in: high G+C Gram-positive bacteria)]
MALLFTVDTVEDLSPHMRRFTFSGDAVGAYIATGQFPNIKIFLPHPDGTYDVPELDDPTSGTETVLRSRPELHARVRTYTVRRYDREKNTLSIDFVLHGDEGIASAWAMRARPGTTLGIAGGGGRHIGQGDHYLIAGDETGLPGIGDILDNLPADATGTAYIEVAGDSGRIDLTKPEGIEVVWLSRDGAPGGTTTLLVDAVKSHELKPNTFAWASAESAQVIAIRKNLRARGVDRKSMLVIGYWRRGLSENGYAKAANHDRDLKEYDDHEHDHDHGVGAAMREGAAHLAGRLRRRRRT